jgi:hypothetical protein
VGDELRSLRLSVRTILVTTEDALAATEGNDVRAANVARERARQLLERLRNAVESSGDPDVEAMYREAWRLVSYGGVLMLSVAHLAV